MKIILIRHGQTEWNKEKVFRGTTDISLNSLGVQQAKAIAERMVYFNLKAVYSSPLKRALETAQNIAGRLNLNVEIDDRLVDFDFGEWQGLRLKEVQEQFADLYRRWLKEPHLARIPGGESLNIVRSRLSEALSSIVEKEQGNMAIVSHRVTNKILICTMLSLDNSHFWQIKQDVGAINIIDCTDGIFTLLSLNDTCHLSKFKQWGTEDF